jgi:hypothetical protein
MLVGSFSVGSGQLVLTAYWLLLTAVRLSGFKAPPGSFWDNFFN